MTRTFLLILLLALRVHAESPVRPPNLLLFMADDMTFTDLGCYGNPEVRTPNLDRLASQGLRFTKFYCSAPMCSPLRQSLYTGLYPVRNGAHPNHSRVKDGIQSLPHYLKPLGYRVALLGKRHEMPEHAFPFEILGGWHGDPGPQKRPVDLPLDQARAFMARDAKQPWCLVVTSNQPHSPWNRGDAAAYPPGTLTVPAYLVDTPLTRDGLSKYYAEITYMDGQAGQCMRFLDELNQAEDTAMLFLSEQGSEMPFCKWTCYDTGIHSAAILHWPGVVKPGVSGALISYVDVLPTFLELAGGQPARFDLDGRSFAGVLRGERATHHDAVFAVQTSRGIHSGPEAYGIRAVTDGKLLYIRNLHADAEFSNTVIRKHPRFASWKQVDREFARARVRAYITRPPEELYELDEDPWCLENRADGHAGMAGLRHKLDTWMRQQGDAGDATERAAQERQVKRSYP